MCKHKCACTNKSRGSEMHWVGGGGGFKSTKGQYPPCKDRTYLCEGRRFFCVFCLVSLKKRMICMHVLV